MAALLFVFGTLKRGFPLHARGLADAAFVGLYRTLERFPLVIAGRWFAPMMLNEPGSGFRVHGELFEVDARALERLDELESVGKPGNLRSRIAVEPLPGGKVIVALAYLKERRLAVPTHSGYLEQYSDRRFIPPEDRADHRTR